MGSNFPPPSDMPMSLAKDFTMSFEIPVYHWYIDNSTKKDTMIWDKEVWDSFKNALTNINIIGNQSDIHRLLPNQNAGLWVLSSLRGISLFGKSIAILDSSNMPWLPVILINNGARDVTIVHTEINSFCVSVDQPGLKSMSFQEFANSGTKYDYIFAFYLLHHMGLGRFGDVLSPNRDLEVMTILTDKTKKLLFVSIPIGTDKLIWNAHRIYGSKRFSRLINPQLLKEERWVGHDKLEVMDRTLDNNLYLSPTPIIILKKLS